MVATIGLGIALGEATQAEGTRERLARARGGLEAAERHNSIRWVEIEVIEGILTNGGGGGSCRAPYIEVGVGYDGCCQP